MQQAEQHRGEAQSDAENRERPGVGAVAQHRRVKELQRQGGHGQHRDPGADLHAGEELLQK